MSRQRYLLECFLWPYRSFSSTHVLPLSSLPSRLSRCALPLPHQQKAIFILLACAVPHFASVVIGSGCSAYPAPPSSDTGGVVLCSYGDELAGCEWNTSCSTGSFGGSGGRDSNSEDKKKRGMSRFLGKARGQEVVALCKKLPSSQPYNDYVYENNEPAQPH
jgi:hypothetical protein